MLFNQHLNQAFEDAGYNFVGTFHRACGVDENEVFDLLDLFAGCPFE